jgi:integrase
MVKDILKKLQPITGKSKWVFESPVIKGQPLTSVKSTTEKIQEVTSVSDFRLHDLRTTLSTHMEENLVEEMVIRKILNHSADGVTGKHYQWYNYNDKKLEALTRWSWRVQSIISSEKPKVKLHKVG